MFKGLSGAAFLLLWALMAANGTLVALLKTAWSGVFPDGTPLKTTYTGIPPIDFPVSILVAFFYGLQNRPGTPPHLMLVDLVAALLVINMMTLVESRRPNAPKWLRSYVSSSNYLPFYNFRGQCPEWRHWTRPDRTECFAAPNYGSISGTVEVLPCFFPYTRSSMSGTNSTSLRVREYQKGTPKHFFSAPFLACCYPSRYSFRL